MSEIEKVRIQKFLSENGVASRRKAEQMVKDGLVSINGKRAEIGDKLSPVKDRVCVNNRIVKTGSQKKRYIMLNKPRGYITTMSDEKNRKCVAELFPEVNERIYPVGRLDKESEGLLLMTNDGDFANHIMHPSRHIRKDYRVTLHSKILYRHIVKFAEGIDIGGYITAPCKVRVISEEPGRTVIEITIHEGKNRQIRRMCEALKLEVARLKRVCVGGIKLGGLPIGKWRELRPDEVSKLMSENT